MPLNMSFIQHKQSNQTISITVEATSNNEFRMKQHQSRQHKDVSTMLQSQTHTLQQWEWTISTHHQGHMHKQYCGCCTTLYCLSFSELWAPGSPRQSAHLFQVLCWSFSVHIGSSPLRFSVCALKKFQTFWAERSSAAPTWQNWQKVFTHLTEGSS